MDSRLKLSLAAPFYFTFFSKYDRIFNDLELLSEDASKFQLNRTEYTKYFRYLSTLGRTSEVKQKGAAKSFQ